MEALAPGPADLAPASSPVAPPVGLGGRWAELIETPSVRGALLHVGSSGEHSGHAIDDFALCPARHAFGYKLKALDPDPNQPVQRTRSLVARVRGSLGHQGLGLHYRRVQARQQGTDPDAFAEPLDGVIRMARDKGGIYFEEIEIVLDTLEVYFRAHRGETLQVLGVETVVPMASWLGGHRQHTRSVDLVATDSSGLIYFLDHKFTGRPARSYIDSLVLTGQMLDYELVGRSVYGDRWGGAWANTVRWPGEDREAGRRAEILRDRVDPAPWAVAHRAQDLLWRYAQRDTLADVDPWSWPCTPSWNACEAGSGCPGKSLCRFGPAGGLQHNALR